MATKTKRNRKTNSDGLKVRGFFRIKITEGDLDQPETLKLIGDSGVDADGNLINGDGLLPNLVTAAGFQQYLALTLAGRRRVPRADRARQPALAHCGEANHQTQRPDDLPRQSRPTSNDDRQGHPYFR